jgi:hypothetical protein
MSEKDISISSCFGVEVPVLIEEFGVVIPFVAVAGSLLRLCEFLALVEAMAGGRLCSVLGTKVKW